EGGAQFMTDACKELALRPIGTFDPLEPLLQLRLELLLLVDMLKRPDDAQKPPRSRLEERSGDHPYPECLFFLQFEPQFLARALPLQQALPASLEKRQILGMDELLELEARSALQQPLREGPSKPFQLEALPHGHVGESQARRHLRDQAVALTRLVSISSGELLPLQQALPASREKRQILGMDERLELEARSALQQPLREGPSKPFQLEALPHGHVGESQVRRHLRDQAVALTRLVSISSGELLRL